MTSAVIEPPQAVIRRERRERAREELLRQFRAHEVVTPELFEHVQQVAGIDQEDLSALLGDLVQSGVVRRKGLGFAVVEGQ